MKRFTRSMIIITMLVATCFVGGVIYGQGTEVVPPEQTCSAKKCCPAMNKCIDMCGDRDNCQEPCIEAMKKCMVKCGYSRVDADGAFVGSGPCD